MFLTPAGALLAVSDKTFHLKGYKQCFTGSDFVDWLVEAGYTGSTVDEATQRDIGVEIGVALQNDGHIDHVTQEHKFKDKPLFYRWCCDDRRKGAKVSGEGQFISFQEQDSERNATIIKNKVFGQWTDCAIQHNSARPLPFSTSHPSTR